jgi:hypothetical protein
VLNGWRDQFRTRRHRNDLLRLLRSSGVRPNNSTRDQIKSLLRGVEASGTPTLHHAAHTRPKGPPMRPLGLVSSIDQLAPWMAMIHLGRVG